MTKRRILRGLLLGLWPAVVLLVACSATEDSDRKDQVEIDSSETKISAVDSATVDRATITEISPDESGTSGPTNMTEQVEQPGTDLSMPGLTYQNMILADGTVLEFALLLPKGYDPTQPYPVLLALPPGAQSREMVDAGLSGYWNSGAAGRDWIVISPVAPGGLLFFRGSETMLPEFLEAIGEQLLVEGDKYHLAGISNGGISAFRIAVQHPELFHSIVVLPGYPADNDLEKLERLRGIAITQYVGEADFEWAQKMMTTQQELERLQVDSKLELVPLDGHVINSITGRQLFDLLDSYR